MKPHTVKWTLCCWCEHRFFLFLFYVIRWLRGLRLMVSAPALGAVSQNLKGGPVSGGQCWSSAMRLLMHKQGTVSHVSVWEVRRRTVLKILILIAGFQLPPLKTAVSVLFLLKVCVNSWEGRRHNAAEGVGWVGGLKLPYQGRLKAPAPQFKPCFLLLNLISHGLLNAYKYSGASSLTLGLFISWEMFRDVWTVVHQRRNFGAAFMFRKLRKILSALNKWVFFF